MCTRQVSEVEKEGVQSAASTASNTPKYVRHCVHRHRRTRACEQERAERGQPQHELVEHEAARLALREDERRPERIRSDDAAIVSALLRCEHLAHALLAQHVARVLQRARLHGRNGNGQSPEDEPCLCGK